MAWYNEIGAENDVVISSRIRFARNIFDYPFASKLDDTSSNEIIEKVSRSLQGSEYKYIDFTSISLTEATSYMEKHYVSPEFVSEKSPHMLILNEEKNLSIMVCEEDHIRLQCIKAGLSLEETYKTACEIDDILDDNLDIAYSETLGYLTHCPTNLGTGLRASVMMFLPALTMTNQISRIANVLSKVGLTIRGLYGEGSEAEGYLYQISNQITLGITEEESIKKLNEIISQIIDNERKLRESLKNDRVTDKVCRSYGTLKYAYMMTSKEFMKLFADTRLGISLNIIKDIDYQTLGNIFISVMPATLVLNQPKNSDNIDIAMNEYYRDKIRAEYIKKEMC